MWKSCTEYDSTTYLAPRPWDKDIPLPLPGVFIDSALAVGEPQQNYRGFQQSITNGPVFRLLGPIAAGCAILVLETSIILGRYPPPESAVRQCLFDEALVQIGGIESISDHHGADRNLRSTSIKRTCYFASKADQNAPFQDVVSHAEEAQEKGWSLNVHLWDNTPHYNYLRNIRKNTWTL